MGYKSEMEFVDIAVLDLPFNRRLELITPKQTGDGLEERAVELS
jgi:hypothetical protein